LEEDEKAVEEKAFKKEIDILRKQFIRIILNADDGIMQVHFEFFSKRLMSLFEYYNPDHKHFTYLNHNAEGWNQVT